MNGLLLVKRVGGVLELQNDSKDWFFYKQKHNPSNVLDNIPDNNTHNRLQHLEMRTYNKHLQGWQLHRCV